MYEKDYVTNVKGSGYRSYHVIVKYPVNMADGRRDILAEFQIRTLAMNFWATIEHSLNYKYKHDIPKEIRNKLKVAADAYFNEMFPIYGMDKFTLAYLIGELSRRVNEDAKALKWFSEVITSRGVSTKLKDLARDQKDLIKEKERQAQEDLKKLQDDSISIDNYEPQSKNSGLFSKFFKKS